MLPVKRRNHNSSHGTSDRLKISTKNNQEYFSEVDIKAEQAIINSIHKAYPEHGIIAEESGYS